MKEIIDVKVQDPPVLEVSVGSNLRARSLAYFCCDIHISIMISMLAAVRDLAHWKPVSVRFVNRNSGTEPHFFVTMVTCHIPQSSNSSGVQLEAPLISQDTLM